MRRSRRSRVNIEFHDSSSAGFATLVSPGGDILINDMSTAGNATITVHSQSMMEIGHNDGGNFLGGGSAGNANITVEGGGFMRFETTGTADAAKITIDGSTSRVAFYDDSTAAQATITVNSGGTLDFSPEDFREGAVRPGGAATAGNATINNNGTTNFFDMSTAGNATIITNFAVTNFFDTSTAGAANITGTHLNVNFRNNSTAGTATILGGQNPGFNAGFIQFFDSSSADHATITAQQEGQAFFHDSSTADHATLIVDESGFLGFDGASSGDQATVINNAGGEVKIANLTTGGTSFGSIAGAGTFNLGSKQLTVGSNNTSTTVSGVIQDHYQG